MTHALHAELLLLLDSLGISLGSLLVTASLLGFRTSLSIQKVVPPSEAARVVSDKLLVVDIVVRGAGPEGDELVQRPWEVVTAVGIDSLEKTEANPDVHGQDVEVATVEVAEADWREDSAETKQKNFDGMGVFSGEAEWSGVLVVDLVDVLVEWAPVEETVEPVVPGILDNEEDSDLPGHGGPGWEWDIDGHATGVGEWVEEPDLWEFDGAVSPEDSLGTSPLLGSSWEFCL